MQKGEEKYRRLVEQSLEGFGIAVGPPPKLVFVNPSFCNIYGYREKELLAMSPQELYGLIHPDDQEIFFGRFADRIAGKEVPSGYELRGIRKDGKTIWLEISAGLVDYLGKPAVQAFCRDITNRKHIEIALRESEAMLNTVLDNLPVGIVIADGNGRIIRVNEVTREVWGVPPETDSWEDYSNWVGWWPTV